MNGLDQNVSTPLVTEASALLAVLPGPLGTATTIIFNLPSIHALYIDVAINASVIVSSVDLVIYCVGQRIAATVNLFAGLQAANTPLLLRYGGSLVRTAGPPQVGQLIGDCYDVRVTNSDPLNAAGRVTVWTAARS